MVHHSPASHNLSISNFYGTTTNHMFSDGFILWSLSTEPSQRCAYTTRFVNLLTYKCHNTTRNCAYIFKDVLIHDIYKPWDCLFMLKVPNLNLHGVLWSFTIIDGKTLVWTFYYLMLNQTDFQLYHTSKFHNFLYIWSFPSCHILLEILFWLIWNNEICRSTSIDLL